MLHYTDKTSHDSIRSQPDWVFKASKPPGNHPKGAYFTNLPPNTANLAIRLRIPATKIEYVFCFADAGDLKPLPGGRGAFIFYSDDDYVVSKGRQHDHGSREEGKCT